MIEAKTIIRLLKHLGIVLIALPEPFTTPFGMAFILVSRYLSKRLEAKKNKRLQEIVKYYLAHTRPFSSETAGKYINSSSVKRYTRIEEHVIPQQFIGNHSFEVNINPSIWRSWHGMRRRTAYHTMDRQGLSQHYKANDCSISESSWADTYSRADKVIYHTINVEWLSRRYECQNSAVAHSSWASTSGAMEGVTPYSVNMKVLSQRYNTGIVGQAKVRRTVNIALPLQHYGEAMCKIALKTLKDNYSYYDLISKGNVIGGY